MMFTTLLATALSTAFLAVYPGASAAPSVIDTGYAKYQGNQSYPNSVAYLGIPYAEPPLGELRFRAPRPLNITRIQQSGAGKILDATKYPDFCVQGKTTLRRCSNYFLPHMHG
jgi:carboxylesterase type B